MGTVRVYDRKDREFLIDYTIEKGRQGFFDITSETYVPADESEISIDLIEVALHPRTKVKVLELTEEQLTNYFNMVDVYNKIWENEL